MFLMRQLILRACALAALAAFPFAGARAQTAVAEAGRPATTAAAAPQEKTSGSLFALEEFERQLRAQREEIEQLRAAVREQSRLINDLRSRVDNAEQLAGGARPVGAAVVREATYTGADTSLNSEPQAAAAGAGGKRAEGLEARVARVEKSAETVSKQVGSMTFFGDLRFRYEAFYGQENALANPDQPGTVGNPLTSRQRLRMRARFGVRGRAGDEFDWGLRLTTGNYADLISTNTTLTDFFTRKPFALDLAYINYHPKALPGFQVQAGKFETPWTRTELTWDNDITVEGLSESYTRTFKKSALKSLSLVAWELPMLERNSGFVLAADGKVDLSASGRAGRDLYLYGAQVRAEVASKHVSLKLSAADLYFSGTQFVTPAQVFGANIQFPVTVVIPAAGTTPARTVTTQVSAPRDLLVAGNANLGLSLANTNAVNRDGRLSSGFNLVDLIA
ncbi:MAG TPA: putative porin, partial [Pyrinomonadaceae bacterium]